MKKASIDSFIPDSLSAFPNNIISNLTFGNDHYLIDG